VAKDQTDLRFIGKTPPFDAQQIKHDECINKPFPLKELRIQKRPSGFQIVIRRSVLNIIKQLGRASMNAEVGGMLIGQLCWDKEPFLLIDASIEGKYTDDQQASVTFTAATWNYVHEELEKHYHDKKIVGWYHTHPGFGIFLSNYDTFIQENFFREKWQVAFVFDPQAEANGFFVWQNGQCPTKPNLKPLIIEDEPETKSVPKHITITDTESETAMNRLPIAEKKTETHFDVFVSIAPILVSLLCIYIVLMLQWQLKAANEKIDTLEQQVTALAKNKEIVNMQKHINEHHYFLNNLYSEMNGLTFTRTFKQDNGQSEQSITLQLPQLDCNAVSQELRREKGTIPFESPAIETPLDDDMRKKKKAAGEIKPMTKAVHGDNGQANVSNSVNSGNEKTENKRNMESME
jgi:proteasome lid subunit RPN8/RPN11